MTDGRGVPIAALISGANVPDAAMISDVLDAVVMRGPRRPEHLCLDKGYDYLLPDRMLATHPELFVGESFALLGSAPPALAP